MSLTSGYAPVVSVICATYNHVNYIAYCLEGLLRQQTDFPFEILVHDDASTDGTSDIVRAYAERYPELIRANIQTENQYSRGCKPRTVLGRQARGQFIAICDGDDRWTDAEKLRKQVRFLEDHPEHVLSYHRASFIDATNEVTHASTHAEHSWRDYSRQELRTAGYEWLPLVAILHRRIEFEFPSEYQRALHSDIFLPLLLGEFGSAGYQADIEPAQQRTNHPNAIWASKSEWAKAAAHANTYFMMARYLARRRELDSALRVCRRGVSRVRSDLPIGTERIRRFLHKSARRAMSKLIPS